MVVATEPSAQSSATEEERFWNPGPESFGERFKLRALHRTTQASGMAGRLFGRLATQSVGILTYHRIAARCAGVPAPTINVTPDTFRQQLVGLQRRGFRFASLGSVLSARTAAAKLRERTVVLTFDDIYDNVFLNALPVLQELRIPATVFISTAFIDSADPFPFDPWAQKYQSQVPVTAWQPITDEHLRGMLSCGLIELGAHTHTHQDFRNDASGFAVDVATGIEILQSEYAVRSMAFAFPYGSPRLGFCDQSLMSVVQDLDLRCGLTTGPHTNPGKSSPFGWGRFHVFEHDSAATLAAKLDGWYEWLPRLKNRFVGKK